MINSIKVAHISETQRIWFVRASSGTFARHFRAGKVIATDHLSEIFEENKLTVLPTPEQIRSAALGNDKFSEFRYNEKEKKDIKVLNHSGAILLSAINKFTSEINAGDLIITKTETGDYMFGVCSSGEAYFSNDPVKLKEGETADATSYDRIKMNYTLRKNVKWGPTVKGSEVPNSVKNSLARNTLTELSELKEVIYHLIYPFFTDGKTLYFSNKIRSTQDINSAVIGKLFQNISLVSPIIQAILDGKEFDPEKLIKQVERSIFSNEILSTSKADFASPGDTWSKIPLIGSADLSAKLVAGVIACLLITGIADLETELSTFGSTAQSTATQTNKPSDLPQIFKDKFQEPIPSSMIDAIKENVLKNKEEIAQLSDSAYVGAINNSLGLEIAQPNTTNLENFEYGMRVHKIGGN